MSADRFDLVNDAGQLRARELEGVARQLEQARTYFPRGPFLDSSAGTVLIQPVASDPVMGASGTNHAAGDAPDPGSSAGTTRFLREDATWAVPSGGGSLEVKQASGSPDYTGISVLVMDQATGLAIESGSSGNPVTLEVLAATALQQGAVSTTTQTFAGNKTFNGNVTAANFSTTGYVSVTSGQYVGCGPPSSGSNPSCYLQFSTGVTAVCSLHGLNGAAAAIASAFAANDAGGISRTGATGSTTEGDTVTGGLITTIGVSDARFKRPGDRLAGATGVVRSVRPLRFRWDAAACEAAGRQYDGAEHVGFLAQELQAALPELVRENEGPDGPYLTLDLPAVVAVLWQAVRELAGDRPAAG
jgi:hypothetical protein